MKPTPDPGQQIGRRSPVRIAGRVAAWLFGVPLALCLLLYLVLLVTPLPLPFISGQVRNVVVASLPEGSRLELGDMALALEGYAWPVIQFSPVVYTDTQSGARVRMDALEVGFSPVRALWGQPGATVTIVGPHIQVNQDLFGPRLVSFNVVPDPGGGRPTVQIIEGADAFPEVDISANGVDVRGELPSSALPMRSDNDWLIYNLEAAERGIASIVEQARLGRFSRLVIRDGTLDMNDALYGLFRTFEDITLDIAPTRDGKAVEGRFSADFGGTVMNGILERVVEDGTARLKASVTNLDLASFLPFINDPEALLAIVGPSALSIDVGFDAATGEVQDGIFRVDMTGTHLRIADDYFPIASTISEIRWDPEAGQFTMAETQISIGESSAWMQGIFKLGLDERYGPTVGMSLKARDVSIHSELGTPEAPFDTMSFRGWSAPLYGALGIDQFRARKADGSRLATTGRIDMLRRGLGLDMTIAGEGITADDLKRLWPYFIATDSRDWFVENVVGGRIKTSTMHYDFPPGTLATRGEDKPIPEGAMSIDIVGTGVKIIPAAGMDPIAIDGETRLEVRDSRMSVAADGGTVMTDAGPIEIADAALVMGGSDSPEEQLIEISGDVSSAIPALVALAREQQPGLLESESLPLDLAALTGSLSLSLMSTIVLDEAGATKRFDYAVDGAVEDFNSSAPLDSHTVADGQLSFVASQDGYRIAGEAQVDGLPAELEIEGDLSEGAPPPAMLLRATLDAEDFSQMGFDVSEFIDGTITFEARPMPDDSLQMEVDITDAAVTLEDIGISKAAGVLGTVRAEVRQDGEVTEVESIDVAFADVDLQGSLTFHAESGLQAAEFTTFKLSPGDSAQLALSPLEGGYRLQLRGEQLDLKPMLGRFFSLGEGSTGGPQATSISQTIVVDAELDRALGFFRTTAFNLDLDMALRGDNLRRAELQAQFGGGRSISVTTNPTPDGKVMSVAFNDLGTVLRLIGVYPNIEGGSGTLVIETFAEQRIDRGRFIVEDFAIVDEDNVAEILGNHQQSRDLISSQNKLEFRRGEADFIRRSDRVEIIEAILAGDAVGGTARGFIYTDSRQYDIAGTYVPLFGLNNVFQKLPIFGPLLGGREGEGLFGVTFAIRGPLDQPDFKINPVSALVPGVFRRIFEYRARELPREQ